MHPLHQFCGQLSAQCRIFASKATTPSIFRSKNRAVSRPHPSTRRSLHDNNRILHPHEATIDPEKGRSASQSSRTIDSQSVESKRPVAPSRSQRRMILASAAPTEIAGSSTPRSASTMTMRWPRHAPPEGAPAPSSAASSVDPPPPRAAAPRPKHRRRARIGDVVTIDLSLTPEDGFVPRPLFDSSGSVALVLGWGNYLPGLHDLLVGGAAGDEVRGASVDAGWGRRDPNLVARVPAERLRAARGRVEVGDELRLEGGVTATVTEETEDGCLVVDANPPLAGSSYACDLRVLEVHPPPRSLESGSEGADGGDGDGDEPALLAEPSSSEEEEEPENDAGCPAEVGQAAPAAERFDSPSMSNGDGRTPSRFRTATFALGCFWGGELAFMRTPGVVGTRVGYTQGNVPHPTYEQVCSGATDHREAILVLYDASAVTYEALVEVAMERLNATSSGTVVNQPHDDGGAQYRHGIYYHTEEQRRIARRMLRAGGAERRWDVELRPAAAFYWAEEYHQGYLLKGGQSARKGCKEPIRCYG